MPRPYAIVSLWEFRVPQNNMDTSKSRRWFCLETYGVDQDGYACTPSKFASKDRHSFDNFMFKEPTKEEEEKFIDREPIMGRAVTTWTMESGVSLAAFHPPEWTSWLSVQFIEELRKLSNWCSFLEDGYTLWAGTARHAEKIFFGVK